MIYQQWQLARHLILHLLNQQQLQVKSKYPSIINQSFRFFIFEYIALFIREYLFQIHKLQLHLQQLLSHQRYRQPPQPLLLFNLPLLLVRIQYDLIIEWNNDLNYYFNFHVWKSESNDIFASGLWCAKVYQHPSFGTNHGWEHTLYETSHGLLYGTNYDNKVSSVKVRDGCTLNGYDDKDLNNWIFTFNGDNPNLINDNNVNVNDKLTSYICECLGRSSQ